MSQSVLRARKRRQEVLSTVSTVLTDPERFCKRKIEAAFPDPQERLEYLKAAIVELGDE